MKRLGDLMLLSLSALAIGCGAGDVSNMGDGNGNGDYYDDLDPNDPPPPPFEDDPFPDDGTCGDINAVVDGLTPTVQLLIDQSGSMTEGFGNGDRWDAVYDTTMGNNAVVPRLQSAIRFGLSLYTSFDGFNGGDCPVVTTVSPALDNFDAMNNIFTMSDPESDTPTGEALDAVVAELQQFQDPGRKIIIVGTDGEPDTCAEPNPQNGQSLAIAAAQRAFDAGIRVYVVSVGDDVGAQHLQDMANAGAGLPVGGTENEPYFVALQPDDLANAFDTIVGGAAGCVFTINGQVDVAKAAGGKVALDGEELDFGTDWIMLDPQSFEVLGESCDRIQDGQLHHISAVFPCGTIVID